jgi:hypothetical protein
MKETLVYVAMAVVLVVVAIVAHLAASLDWPWAIAAGAAAVVLVRAVIEWRSTGRGPSRKTPVRP